jgi:predicted AAA+ superfamily ATPase
MKEELAFPMYRISESVRITYSDDGVMVLAIHTGKVLRSNPTGSVVLQYLQQRATVPEIIAAVSSRFGLSLSVAATDVSEFLKTLEELALVDRIASVSSSETFAVRLDRSKASLAKGISK